MKLENFKNGYDVTNGSLLALNEKNDCAVRAIANAFNITYDNAHTFTANKLPFVTAYPFLKFSNFILFIWFLIGFSRLIYV